MRRVWTFLPCCLLSCYLGNEVAWECKQAAPAAPSKARQTPRPPFPRPSPPPKVLAALPVQRLKRSTLFVDVLSVKEFPKQAMLRMLPADADILCTHPMFGPDSGQGSWSGLNFMYEVARLVPGDAARQQRMQNFIRVRRGLGKG